MKISIGSYDVNSRSVPVTFTEGDIIHRRSVNAVLNDKGAYDRAATKARVDEVAAGVAVKIAAGAIGNEPEAPLPASSEV